MSDSIKRLFGVSANRRSLFRGGAALTGAAAIARFAPAQRTLAQEPTPGGHLVIAFDADPEILDPHKSTALLASRTLALMHDNLVTKDFEGQLQPGLADSWEISEDGLTYTFALKSGVTFHSGKEFSSADVKYTFDRWLADEASPTAYNFASVASVDAPDPATVVFNLNTTDNLLLEQISGGWAVIINQEAVEAAGDQYGVSAVDGTGPYKFESWQRSQSVQMSRHEAYTWGPSFFANTGPVYPDSAEIRIIPEAATRIAEFQSGNVHLVATVPNADVERLTDADGVTIVQYEQLQTTYLGMNQAVAPTSDLAVRQAITYAINKEEIAFGAFFGLGIPAISMLHPGTPGYWPGVVDIAPTFDPERAKIILEEAGWTEGDDGIRQKDGASLDVPFWVINNPETVLTAQILEQQLAEVGIRLQTEQYEQTAWFEAARSGEQTAFIIGVFYENADILYFYFHTDQLPAPNRFTYSVPEVDAWLEDTRSNTDPAVVQAAYQSIQERLITDAVTAPLLHALGTLGIADTVQGVNVHPGRWLYRALDISLAE
jgi:peptide/nickel transport system substrate-binding protein